VQSIGIVSPKPSSTGLTQPGLGLSAWNAILRESAEALDKHSSIELCGHDAANTCCTVVVGRTFIFEECGTWASADVVQCCVFPMYEQNRKKCVGFQKIRSLDRQMKGA